MADLGKIGERISEIAGRRHNVTLDEIEWVVNQLARNGYTVSSKKNDHQKLFSVDQRRFGVCSHKQGSKQIKRCYVDEFLDAMIDLGLYED
ncbi:MAG: hypothetical protein ABI165_21610 [Bryobacteraceae bacterium]